MYKNQELNIKANVEVANFDFKILIFSELNYPRKQQISAGGAGSETLLRSRDPRPGLWPQPVLSGTRPAEQRVQKVESNSE